MREKSKRPAARLVELDLDAWRIVDGVADGQAEATRFTPAELADEAAAMRAGLEGVGWRGEPVALGLTARRTLAATVVVPAPQMLKKRQLLRYRLEEWIPLTAEDFVCDFVPHRDSALMVAVERRPLEELVAALERLDVRVLWIGPIDFLALAAVLESLPDAATLVARRGARHCLFTLRDGKPHAWRDGPAVPAIEAALESLCTADSDAPTYAWGLDAASVEALAGLGFDVRNLEGRAWDEAAVSEALSIACAKTEPLVDLRRDELAGDKRRRPTARQSRRLKAALVLAALAACAASWRRADQYAAAASDAQKSLAALYAETFPDKPLPERVLEAFRSEERLAKGARGAPSALPQSVAADAVFERILRALPNDMRFRVPEVRVEGASVQLAAEVRSNADADRIAQALREAGFETAAPKTQRLAEEGFSVRLAAVAKAESTAQSEAP